jgi:hypothetical protein
MKPAKARTREKKTIVALRFIRTLEVDTSDASHCEVGWTVLSSGAMHCRVVVAEKENLSILIALLGNKHDSLCIISNITHWKLS